MENMNFYNYTFSVVSFWLVLFSVNTKKSHILVILHVNVNACRGIYPFFVVTVDVCLMYRSLLFQFPLYTNNLSRLQQAVALSKFVLMMSEQNVIVDNYHIVSGNFRINFL